MKEVIHKHSDVDVRSGMQHLETAQAAFGSMELPHMALAGGQGPVLSDEALLRLFCEGAGVPINERTSFCENMLMRFGSLAAMFSSEQRTLSGIVSLNRSLICTFALLHEAAIRVSRARMGEGDILSNPRSMLDYLKSRLAREPIEQFRILFLDERNCLLADEAQTRGTVNHTPVYPREVARRAMEIGAKSIVLVHNHPSGDPTPSEGDIAMTRDTQRAAALIEVRIADHIIIGNGSYSSFRELGLMSER